MDGAVGDTADEDNGQERTGEDRAGHQMVYQLDPLEISLVDSPSAKVSAPPLMVWLDVVPTVTDELKMFRIEYRFVLPTAVGSVGTATVNVAAASAAVGAVKFDVYFAVLQILKSSK